MFRPDAVFSPDPGGKWNQWHKTDHRMAANITQDAFIAAEWHLYYPQHYLDEINFHQYGVLLPHTINEITYHTVVCSDWRVISNTLEFKFPHEIKDSD